MSAASACGRCRRFLIYEPNQFVDADVPIEEPSASAAVDVATNLTF
jgi:hypothetical protein